MKTVASILVVPALLCALAGQGRADESASVPAGKWYGYQIMLADAASLGALVLGAQTEATTPLAYLGVGSYLVAPAVIHGVHHSAGQVVASPLMRIVLPAIGASGGSVLGFAGGMVAAMLIDAGIAWDPANTQPVPPPAPKVSNRPSRISLTNAGIAPTRNGAQLVLGGSF